MIGLDEKFFEKTLIGQSPRWQYRLIRVYNKTNHKAIVLGSRGIPAVILTEILKEPCFSLIGNLWGQVVQMVLFAGWHWPAKRTTHGDY
jgi:hypothetical protein